MAEALHGDANGTFLFRRNVLTNPDRPEYINAISALYITGIGFYNLRKVAKK